MHDFIEVRDARVHNLKGVDLDIPRDKVVVFAGVSGSGKSSLVFDTLHTEAQRQLIETFSSFARRRLPKLSRPEVEAIHNLSTSIVIDQKRMGRTLRSTVGSATEAYTYLKMLFARCGSAKGAPSFIFGFNNPAGMCPACKGLGKRISIDIDALLDRSLTLREGAITHPDWKVGGWNWREITAIDLLDVDKPLVEFTSAELELLLYADSVPITKTHGAGTYAKTWKGVARRLEDFYLNRADDESQGRKDAYQRYLAYRECDDCGGLRINERARSVRLAGIGIGDAVSMELTDLDAWLATIDGPVAEPLVRKIRRILGHLIEIGVGYLTLNRAVSTLSGGESQRVKMARQLDCDLVGMMYVLDEPSIGLHARDTERLVGMLRRLQERGNSVLVVEHDASVIRSADHVVEIGPVAGREGGTVVFDGSVDEFLVSEALTARFMRDDSRVQRRNRRAWTEAYRVRGASANNLRAVDVDVPKGVLVAVTGVAGSGKSSLMQEVFIPAHPEAVVVDQGAIGRSSRSNPVTYLGTFDAIRKRFAKATGRPAALFSFNSKGACPECKGAGSLAVEMNFLDDVRMVCPVCEGKRYTAEVLELRWDGRSIHDVLSMTAAEAAGAFADDRELHAPLALMCDVGLEYLALGQPLSTLSGGECQRLKLAVELGNSGNLYVLDEPTTGLHPADIDRLMRLLDRLVDDGNSVIVIEHDLSVIARSDWVIDLGPEGGKAGGELVDAGTPEAVAAAGRGHTGRYLREVLAAE